MQPYAPDSLLKRNIRPAAVRAKIAKHIGWHTFRRTFTTLLKANGEDVKVVQELRAGGDLGEAGGAVNWRSLTQTLTQTFRAVGWVVAGQLTYFSTLEWRGIVQLFIMFT